MPRPCWDPVAPVWQTAEATNVLLNRSSRLYQTEPPAWDRPVPPVPLLASHYNRRQFVPRTIHEHLTFCRWFGAQTARANTEQPDHLLNELAFLIRLDQLLFEGPVKAQSCPA
jgi:hypothetical protein